MLKNIKVALSIEIIIRYIIRFKQRLNISELKINIILFKSNNNDISDNLKAFN